MLPLPSVQNEYALVYSQDPALMLPEHATERANALRVARETGEWARITQPGAEPTLFVFRQIHGTALSWFRGEVARRRLSEEEILELAFRLALRRVENLGPFKLELELGASQVLVSEKTMNALYDINRELDPEFARGLVLELGAIVLKRTTEGLPPKR